MPDDIFPVSPNPNGEWEHVTINPAFQVPSSSDEDDEDSEVETPTLKSGFPDDSQDKKSNTGGIVSGVLVSLLVVGAAGMLAYRKRNMKEDDPRQFETDWWKNQFTSEWWKGDDTIEPESRHANIAPARLTRGWSYPEGHVMSADEVDSKKWEYSNDHGDLHDIIL